MSPPFGGRTLRDEVKGGDEGDISSRQYTSSEKEKAAFENDPESHPEFRRKIEAEINLLFPLYTRGTDTRKTIPKVMLEEMLRRIGPGHELKGVAASLQAMGISRL
ncbi:hypothetical protein LTR28_003984 [Elasticomyces elasticus]|nr:hypothetical protein LTR28_003984 [Elasticomyces elasticus]